MKSPHPDYSDIETPERAEANQDMFAPGTTLETDTLPTEEQMTPEHQAYINGSTPVSAMTIREEFAARAMQGYLAKSAGALTFGEIVENSVAVADALLLELTKTEGPKP